MKIIYTVNVRDKVAHAQKSHPEFWPWYWYFYLTSCANVAPKGWLVYDLMPAFFEVTGGCQSLTNSALYLTYEVITLLRKHKNKPRDNNNNVKWLRRHRLCLNFKQQTRTTTYGYRRLNYRPTMSLTWHAVSLMTEICAWASAKCCKSIWVKVSYDDRSQVEFNCNFFAHKVATLSRTFTVSRK